MKVKTSELIDFTLDCAVAKAQGFEPALQPGFVTLSPIKYLADWNTADEYSPSTDWAQGGPIIEREKICITPDSNYELRGGRWSAVDWSGNIVEFGSTPLIAAMRCFVASKLGDEVEVPDKLFS